MRPVLVSCAEASGDLLAGGVIAQLKAADPGRRVLGIGGKHCREAGAETPWDVSELSVMGIAEVVPKLRRILRILDEIEALAARERPETALLVDAPDFNLRLAKRLKRLGVRVVYYVSPSVWAWRPGRVKAIARSVDEMCCVLPFEELWYRERGVPARFVGHPLLERQPDPSEVRALRAELLGGGSGPLLALLPGSRAFEVRQLLPPMLAAARQLARETPRLEVAIPVAPTIPKDVVERFCREAGFAAKVLDGRARELLSAADAAIVASGTASLEAALAQVPSVVAYRASVLTWLVFRLVVRAPFIGLPNIVAGEEVVPEVLQWDVRPEVLAARVRPLLSDTPERARMVEALARVKSSLGAPGASRLVAGEVLGKTLPEPPARALHGGK